mgnify:CR=1 FL=1
MPTEKPRITITMSADQLAKVEQYRFENRCKNQTQAILALIKMGLDDAPDLSEALQPSSSELELIKKYRGLDDCGRKHIDIVIDHEAERLAQVRQRPTAAKVIPLRVSLQAASAGTGAYLGPEEFETISVEDNALTRRASFAVPIAGDSMEPDFHDGDIILVEGADDVRIGEIGVFTVDGDGYVKERGEHALLSLNQAYASVPLTNGTWCNGRVIGVLDPDWVQQ